jgi:hypothetical protein
VSQQPVAGTLTAKLIRACPAHADCPLECPERIVEDLGTLAAFDHRPRGPVAWLRRALSGKEPA